MKPASSSSGSGAIRRQEPISCWSCRRRKLRCNRQNPCSNCVARKVACEREGSLPPASSSAIAPRQEGFNPGSATDTDGEIITRLERLEKLILRLSDTRQDYASPSTGSGLQQATPDTSASLASNSNDQEAARKVDSKQLEDVGTRYNLTLFDISDGVHFEVVPIQHMPDISIAPLNNGQRLVIIPVLAEALLLLDIFLEHVDYQHHITLSSKVRSQIVEFYAYISEPGYLRSSSQQQHIEAALTPAALIVAIFASAMACIAEFHDGVPAERLAAFSHLASIPLIQAKACSQQWIKSTFQWLEHARHVGSGCLADVQAMITVVFLVYNLEGFSSRTRTGVGYALCVARDLGLHRLDYGPDRQAKGSTEQEDDPVEMEIKRRVWWHLCASDWVASISGGPQEGVYSIQPRHMCVNLPRNINDSDLMNPNTPVDLDLPLSVPTSTSYLIQRIKLGTICRKIVDAMPMSPNAPEMIPYEIVVALDREFEKLLDELPPFFQIGGDAHANASAGSSAELGTDEDRYRGKRQRKTNPRTTTLPMNAARTPNSTLTSTSTSTPYTNYSPTSSLSLETRHIATQRFMIRVTTHTRRCKLHSPFLVRGFTDPKYHYSRDACLRSARIVVSIQHDVDHAGLVPMGLLGLSGINHHLFFACIALVLDLCFNREKDGGREEERRQEVRRAVGVLEEARERSAMAKRFLVGLRDVLRRRGVRLGDEREHEYEDAGSDTMGGKSGGEVGGSALPGHDTTNAVAAETTADVLEPQMSDFDAIWQTYINYAPNFEAENWEELLGDTGMESNGF